MSDDNLCLPFPRIENVTSPIENIHKFHKDGEKRNADKYYFTIGIDKFRPSPCTFVDVAATRAGEAHRLMLVVLFHLLDVNFYCGDPDVIQMPDGGRRVRVFMEFLLHEDVNPDDFTMIDCMGIRFHIHIYDSGIDFLKGILAMLNGGADADADDGGGGDGGDDGGDGGGDDGTRRRKKRKKAKQASPMKKKVATPIQYSYRDVNSISRWYKLAGVISESTTLNIDTYMLHTSGPSHDPDDDHPFHPTSLFSWERSLVDGMREGQRCESDIFDVPSAVYYINGYMTTPHAILGVTLPNTPMWFEQPDMRMIKNTFDSLYCNTFMDSFFEKKNAFIKRNDLAEIRHVQDQRKRKVINDNDNPEHLPIELRKFRERSMKYLANAWSPSAFVSDPIKIMARASGDIGSWTSGPMRIVDRTLTSFGNMMADAILCFENILRISTTHATLLRLIVNSLDAYRYEFNLHNNVLMVGAGATGKSHLLECLEKVLYLPGTVDKITHMTDKAMTIDTDTNDAILTFHEMPPLLMGNDKNSNETGSHQIKDMMTSCKVDTKSIVVEEGRRMSVSVSSETVGVMIMASNEARDLIPEALGTRMIFIQVNSNTRKKFSINDMTSSVDGVTGGDYFKSDPDTIDFDRRWKVTQIMVNMVEKAIYIGALENVNIRVFETLQLKMTDYMKTHEIMQNIGNDRDIKFLKRFARTLTIIHAVNKFANDYNSPGYDPEGKIRIGSPESFDKLLQIQPYLFCTEEIALFTLTLNVDQLVQVHHFQVMEVVLALVEKYLVKAGTSGYDEQDGFLYTKAVFQDERYIYRKLNAIQNTDAFPTKLSSENIKVAFRELRRRVHDEKTIIEFNSNTQTMMINSAFVKKHFTWDSAAERFYCNFDINTIMSEVFYKSYANKHTKPIDTMVLGTTYDRELPFLFNTMAKKPNPTKELTRFIAQSNAINGVDGTEVTEDYVRHNDTVKFKVDFEDFCYRKYLEKCGFDPSDYDVTDIVYDHHVSNPRTSHAYPEHFVDWFKRFTNITPEREQKHC